MRVGADHDEEGVGGHDLAVPAVVLLERQLPQARVAVAVHDEGPWTHGDRPALSRTEEVARHRVGAPVTAGDQGDVACVLGEVEGRLTGRVAAAGDEDFHVEQRSGLGRQRPVEDAGTAEGVQPRHRQPPVGDQVARMTACALSDARSESATTWAARPRAKRRRLVGEQELGAELPRLLVGTEGELVAGDAGGEAEVVVDHGALAGLAAEGLTLEHHGAEALGRAVDGGGEAGRPGADDEQIDSSAHGRLRTPSDSATSRLLGSTRTRPPKTIATGRRGASSMPASRSISRPSSESAS